MERYLEMRCDDWRLSRWIGRKRWWWWWVWVFGRSSFVGACDDACDDELLMHGPHAAC